MTSALILWLASAMLLYATALLVPGFKIQSFGWALVASLMVGFLNLWMRPLLLFLTLPINILTLGFFTFVVNAIVLRVAAGLLRGFEIQGWFPAILGAVVLALLQTMVHFLYGGTTISWSN